MIKVKELIFTILLLTIVGCSSTSQKDTTKFDTYLEQLMAEPYNPTKGSKY